MWLQSEWKYRENTGSMAGSTHLASEIEHSRPFDVNIPHSSLFFTESNIVSKQRSTA
jgi:hypothetical protein